MPARCLMPRPSIVRTACGAALALGAALVTVLTDALPTVAAWHFAFAVGLLPLIAAAMLHFVPVLTRTGTPPRGLAHWPDLAQLLGLTVPLLLAGYGPAWGLPVVAALLATGSAVLLGWIVHRLRRALGGAHPGAAWYAGALLALCAALLCVVSLPWLAPSWAVWRAVHAHLNTFGLVGLAALGTLPVLLPTAVGQPDPGAARWLRQCRAPAFLAVVLLAMAPFWTMAGVLGALLWWLISGHLARRAWRLFGGRLWADPSGRPLWLAMIGLMLAVTGGAGHALGDWPSLSGLALWAMLFLLPLVSGALTQLLPVWSCPGPGDARRPAMKAQLGRGLNFRLLAWSVAGALVVAGQPRWGGAAALLGVAQFLLMLVQALRVMRSTR